MTAAHRFFSSLLALMALGPSAVLGAEIGPSNGSLVIIGGGLRDEAILKRS